MNQRVILRLFSFILKTVIFYILIIGYHIMIDKNANQYLTQFDINLTTGFKPMLPVVEFGVTSLVLSAFLVPDLFPKNETPITNYLGGVLIVLKFLILVVPPISIQFLHQYYDHDGRWHYLEDWTYPGYQGTMNDVVPWFMIIFLSTLGVGLSIELFHNKRIEKYFKKLN